MCTRSPEIIVAMKPKKEFPDFYDNVVLNGNIYKHGARPYRRGSGGGSALAPRSEILAPAGVFYLGTSNENNMICANRSGNQVRQFIKSWKNLFEDAYLKGGPSLCRMCAGG